MIRPVEHLQRIALELVAVAPGAPPMLRRLAGMPALDNVTMSSLCSMVSAQPAPKGEPMNTTATLPARPVIGQRVIVDTEFLGQTIPVEVVVVQVDDDGPRGVRIIGRPEGTFSTAYMRHEWREVTS